MTRLVVVTLCVAGLGLAALPVAAATCRDPAGFGAFIASIKKEAAAQGISPSAISALDNVSYDPGIISKDHGQGVFHQSFAQFSARMANPARVRRGQTLLKQYAGLFSRIDETYGVPGPVL